MDHNPLGASQMPQTIGRYQVQEAIGFGAMGAVYKAFDPLIKRTLAIKTIRLDIPKNSPQYKSFIERFYHEARISGTLSHPNIVTLFDIGEEGGLPYLAMEFVEGETLASLVERGVKFKPEKVISLVSQIASAIDYAHSKGVIHRDIKPSNLILSEGERVKVTDFGIAKLADAEMTQSGTLLGTPSYMSPEQAMGDKLDGRSDIFSLGVCAFEMLSGEQPFPGNNVTSILYKLVHVDPVAPANLEMHGLLPEKWHQVFNKVLAKRPDDRYQTASEFVQDLEYCLGAWFGAAMPDEVTPEAEATTRLPVVTTAAPPAAVKTHPPVPPAAKKTVPPPAPPPEPEGATVVLKAPPAVAAPPAPAEEKTIVMKAPAAAPARPARPAAPAPPPAQEAEEKTIILKAQPDKVAPPKAPAARAAAPAAPRPPAPPSFVPPPADEQGTLVLGAGAAAKAASAPRSAPPPVAERPTPPPSPPRPSRPVPPPPPDDSTTPVALPPPPALPAGPEPRAPGRSSGPPLGLILGGAGLVLMLLLVGGGVFAWKKFAAPPPTTLAAAPPTPAPPSVRPTRRPPAPSGVLHVESQPPGATVSVNGETKGTTPLDLSNLLWGNYQVTVDHKGYAAHVETISLSEAAPRGEVKVALSRTAPTTGAADVFSNPPGAAVAIDGAPAGRTPLSVPRLKPGSHKVDVTQEGYQPWSGTLVVQPGGRARVEAQLVAVPKPPSPVTPSVDLTRVFTETEVDTPPKKTSGRSASYPSSAPTLKRGQRASVTVSFVVTEKGEVTDLQVIETGGAELDESVLKALKSWKFTPGVKHGTKVKVKLSRRHTFLGG